MVMVPENYLPKGLNKKQREFQRKQLKRSRKAYKENKNKKDKYYTRKPVPGYKSRRTSWAKRAEKIHNVKDIDTNTINKLSKATQCSKKSLNDIIKKGMGAYFSAGSRPNQTAHSWGYARLYSAISGGPASKVDMHILEKGCKKTSKALKLAKSKKKTVKKKKVVL